MELQEGEKPNIGGKLQLIHYWKILSDAGFDSSFCYTYMVQKATGSSIAEEDEAAWNTVGGGESVNPLKNNVSSTKLGLMQLLPHVFYQTILLQQCCARISKAYVQNVNLD